ncbi:DUF4912 domain-containing protein [Cystobacter ferrugineus]|uniref:DUF4912 domain-containing protein n=1 Tax=Cystobacter ferrugineus TaxID=83449 RepID=A0A1L9B7C7_9BACT|nr:DUF4912 domain-containing protein [Cystobacter ferrugineus]OJH38113.1 hypothetical protein BON30_23435 [Cystobacter ferrugineus]
MADRKRIMVEHLREFAHTQWGRGVDRLKARKGLLGALATRVDELVTLMGLRERDHDSTGAPSGVPASQSPAEPPTSRPEAPAAPKRPLPGDDDFPPAPKAELEPVASAPPAPPVPPAPAAPPPEPARFSSEPLVEGFFVARIAGEDEARRHHLTGASNAPPPDAPGGLLSNGSLGTLPMDYEDDTVVLLPRDPHTLFVFWDFKASTRERAAQGLEYPRVVMRLLDEQGTLLGVTDVALESRSFYLGGLPAGRAYRVELHFVGRDGRSRRIGHSSNRVVLPPAGPSADTSVRFLRMPSPAAWRATPRPGSVALRIEPDQERDYITWRRVSLPGSAERLEPRVPERAAPPGEQDVPAPGYLHVPRAEGSSSEGRVAVPRPAERAPGEVPVPAGPPETAPPERWVWSHGPGGSSEIWLDSAGPSGSSEQSAWPTGVPQSGGDARAPTGPLAHGFASQGPAGSSEQAAGVSHAREGVVQWIGSHGPAGSSEQVPGAPRRGEGVVQWMWVYGPVEQGPGLAGSPRAAGQWVWSSGPAGSSEQGPGSGGPSGAAGRWVWSSGPAGSSGPGW